MDELREILQARDRGLAPCRRVHALALEKARDLGIRIRELETVKLALEKSILRWGRRLKSTAPGARAGLLEMFLANYPESVNRVSPLVSPGLKKKLQRNEARRK